MRNLNEYSARNFNVQDSVENSNPLPSLDQYVIKHLVRFSDIKEGELFIYNDIDIASKLDDYMYMQIQTGKRIYVAEGSKLFQVFDWH